MGSSIATRGVAAKLCGIATAGVLLLSTRAALGQSPPPGRRPAPPERWGPAGRPGQPPQTTQISGTVQSYNLGPHGNVEGLMIKTGDRTAQVNLPPEFGPVVTRAAAVGSEVKLDAIPQPGMPDHPVYDFYSMQLEGGRQLKVPSPEDRKFVHLDGTIKSLNYGHHGEVNGAMLDSGDFVQLGPEAQELNLQAGTKLVVDGISTPMLASEHQVIHAVAVNGKVIQPPPRPEGPGGPADEQRPPRAEPGRRGPRGIGGPTPPPPPDGNGPRRERPGQTPPPPSGNEGNPPPPSGADEQ